MQIFSHLIKTLFIRSALGALLQGAVGPVGLAFQLLMWWGLPWCSLVNTQCLSGLVENPQRGSHVAHLGKPPVALPQLPSFWSSSLLTAEDTRACPLMEENRVHGSRLLCSGLIIAQPLEEQICGWKLPFYGSGSPSLSLHLSSKWKTNFKEENLCTQDPKGRFLSFFS